MMDFRDPWGGDPSTAWRSSPYYRSHIARGVTAMLERLAVSAASGVLCNTRESAQELQGRYPRANVRWFPNGVDRELLPALNGERYPGVGIACAGTLYGGRDARPILRGLRLFLDRQPKAAAEGTKLRIAGDIAPQLGELFRREVMALGLGERVEELGVLPRAEALRVAGRSRLAVVLAQDQELEVPAKLYELVAMNVPTLVLTSAGSATASEARRIGAVAVDPSDAEGIARLLEDVWLGRPESISPPRSQPEMIDYRDLAAVSARVLLNDAVAL
jgi:glycosyltransferase involved in cell wall biosynthesis